MIQIDATLTGPAPRVVVCDFFCGCGGTSAGLRASGLKIAAGVDFDAHAAETYRRNFPEARFFETDVRDLSVAAFDDAIPAVQDGLVFAACAPCQPYSPLRRGSSKRSSDRTLLLQLLPFIEHHVPDVVLVENVPGMQAVPGGSTWSRFVTTLTKLGYHVMWNVVDCREYGVPQRRRRLVLLASLLAPLELPDPTHGPSRKPYSTVGEWIADLPPLRAGEAHPDDPNHRAGALGPLNLERIRALEEGEGRDRWPERLWLDCHRDRRGHQDAYGRLHRNRVAPVLTTKCTDITNGRYGHPTQDRALSVREAACLQTFPRTFEFSGGLKQTTRQVGNAVPVLLAQRLGERIVEHVIEYRAPLQGDGMRASR